MVRAKEDHQISFDYEVGTATDGNRKQHPKGWSHYVANFTSVECIEKKCSCINEPEILGEEVPFWAMEGFFEFVESASVNAGFQTGRFMRVQTDGKNEAIFE